MRATGENEVPAAINEDQATPPQGSGKTTEEAERAGGKWLCWALELRAAVVTCTGPTHDWPSLLTRHGRTYARLRVDGEEEAFSHFLSGANTSKVPVLL